MEKLIPLTGAEVIGDHRLRLTFADGLIGDIDLSDRNWRGVSEPLADPGFFAQARIDPEIRTVVWPNGYDIAPEMLYELASRRRHASAFSS